MISYTSKGIRYCEVWFDEPIGHGPDVVIGRQRTDCPSRVERRPFDTLVVDLNPVPDEILKGFSSGTRYEVRRAEKSDELSVDMYFQPLNEVDAFCKFYDLFASTKGLPRARPEHLRRYIESSNLVLSKVIHADQAIVWHAYYCASGRARLLHSASTFRSEAGANRNLIGRANRYLHWRDILRFKEAGYRQYDLGGWTQPALCDAEKQRINEFKEGLGGAPLREFNYTYATSLKGRAMLRLRRFFRRTV